MKTKMQLLGTATAALLLLVGGAVPTLADTLTTRTFQTPSGNIACALQHDNLLRCDIRSGLNPEPKKPCPVDWVGLLLSRMHRARPNCAGDTNVNGDPPVLAYGQQWQRRGRICTSRRSGLYCQNFSGYHFKLSRDSWDRWYRP
jgi:hypothetical protein